MEVISDVDRSERDRYYALAVLSENPTSSSQTFEHKDCGDKRKATRCVRTIMS